MNGPRITAQVVGRIERLSDALDEALAGHPLTPEEAKEIREIRCQLDELYQLAMTADEGVGKAVTLLRRGPRSKWLAEQGGVDNQDVA